MGSRAVAAEAVPAEAVVAVAEELGRDELGESNESGTPGRFLPSLVHVARPPVPTCIAAICCARTYACSCGAHTARGTARALVFGHRQVRGDRCVCRRR